MTINQLYEEFDSKLQDTIRGILWARDLYENRDNKPTGKAEHTYKALQRKQAILDLIYRTGYVTSSTANMLLQHTTRNTTSTFLTNMIKEGLIRKFEVRSDERFIYLIRKPYGIEFLKRTYESVGIFDELEYEIDATKIGSGESIYHHELISQEALIHARYGEGVLFEPEIKVCARNVTSAEIFNPKLTDLIVSKTQNDESFFWIGYEFEVSQKSEERIYHMLRTSDFLCRTEILYAIVWKTNKNKTFEIIRRAINDGHVPAYSMGQFGKLNPLGKTYELMENSHQLSVIDEQKTSRYKASKLDVIADLDYQNAL